MFYDKKIKYFEERENGQRLRGVGFVKLEVREDVCNLLLQISGLHKMNQGTGKVWLIGVGKEVEFCEITFAQGKGVIQQRLDKNNLCQGISYDRLEAMRIPLVGGGELYCSICEREYNQEKLSLQAVQDSEYKREEITCVERNEQEEKTDEDPQEQLKEQREEQAEGKPEEQIEERAEGKPKEQIGVSEGTWEKAMPLLEDKWKQLSAIYTHINPFQDEREYLSIGPGDFVIFDEKYYGMVNNSFLLHGYYNYKHLILTRLEMRGEHRYYIGVPGNFYEREKQVALMFGFESFECREEPARSGDYGYYMMRVEL